MKTIKLTTAAFLSLSLVVLCTGAKAQEEKKTTKAVFKTVEIHNGDTSIVTKEFDPSNPADKEALEKMILQHDGPAGGKRIMVKVIDDGTGKKIEKTIIGADGQEIKMDGNTNVQEEDVIMPDGKKGKKITVISTSKDGDGTNIDVNEHQMKFITDDGKEIQIELPNPSELKTTDGTIKVITHKDGSDNEQVFAFKAKEGSKPIIIRIKEVTSPSKSANKTAGLSTDKLVIDAVKVFPNPNNGKFNIGFTLPEKGTTEIKVTDIAGKEIFSETLKDFTGAYNKELDLTEKVSGSYFISVMQNGKRTVKQIIKE